MEGKCIIQTKGGRMMEDRELLRMMRQNPEQGIGLVMKQYAALCYYIVKQKLSGLP